MNGSRPDFQCVLRLLRPTLAAAVLLAVCWSSALGALAALETPPDLGPNLIGPTGAAEAPELPDLKVTTAVRAAKGFKPAAKIKLGFTLPDEPLIPGRVYHATVTWTVPKDLHLNGELAGSPNTPFSTLRLLGDQIESGAVSHTGTLQAIDEEGIAPYFHEKTVTADLPFRVARAAPVGQPVTAMLEIDSSFCSETGFCYTFICTPLNGQRYTVTFQTAGPAAAADEAFPPARKPPVTPVGGVPAPGTPVPSAAPQNPPATPATGAMSSLQPEPPPASVWAIVTGDLAIDQKVQALYTTGGIGVLLLFVGAFGMLTTTLPCTYPLIPITARILGARATNREPQPGDPTRSDAFAASLFYMLGLTVIYGIIGGLGSAGSKLITGINNQAWFNIGIAVLFAILALGMFGLFEIKLPNFIANRLQGGPAGQARKHGLVSNGLRGLTMGTLAAVLAGACTAPVVLAAVLLITKLGLGFFEGFLILAPFGFGFGLPYFLLTNFVSKLPAPGQWMELIKILFGTLILLFGFYFWNNTVPDPVAFWGLMGVALVGVGIGFGALDRLEAPVAATQRIKQVVTLCLTIAGGFFLVVALQIGLGLATGNSTDGAPSEAIQWESYQTFDIDQPDGSGRPVYIFFHSPSCQYCKKMLATAFRDPDVIALTKGIRMIDADAHFGSEQLDRLQEKFGYAGQPWHAFLDARHQLALGPGELSAFGGYIDTAGVKQRFQQLLGRSEPAP